MTKKCAFTQSSLIAALSLIGTSAIADTVVINDGSTISGEILKIEDGKIEIKTAFAGTISIDQSQTTSFTSDDPVFVSFASGNTIHGKVSSNGQSVQVTSEDGVFTSTVDKVTASWQEGEDSPEVKKLKAEAERIRPKWKYELYGEVTGKNGNADGLGTGIGAKAVLKSPFHKLRFYGDYAYSETNNEVEDDNARVGSEYQNNFRERTFWFIETEFGRDNVQDLDLYTFGGAGLGYQFIKEEKHELDGKLGLAYRYEDYGSQASTSAPALSVAANHAYEFGQGKIYTNVRWLPSLDQFSDFLFFHETGLELPVGTSEGWRFRAGVSNDYVSEPTPGKEKLDTKYFTRLVYSWD